MDRRRPILSFVLTALLSASAAGAQQPWPMDTWLAHPVDDATFQTYQQFFAYDRSVPLDVRVLDTLTERGVWRERLTYQSTPGERVFANFYRAVGGEGPSQPGVVLLHGGVAAGKDSPGTVAIAVFLARAGFSVLAIDMPYFGERGGKLLTTYTEEEKHTKLYNQPPLYLTWVTQVTRDASRGLDVLVSERWARTGHVGLVGFSRGAEVGTIVGAVEKRFAAVALMYGGHMDHGETAHLPAACPANYIGRISPRPLFMANGTLDQDYSRERSVEPLQRWAKQPKTILWFETGHQAPPPEMMAAAVQFLHTHID